MKAIIVLCIGMFAITSGIAQSKFEKTSMSRASVELNCPKENIRVLRTAAYTGGALVVLNACDKIAYYECMGTVCQPRCVYTPKAVDFAGVGETDGKFSKLVKERAMVEFEATSEEIKQLRHFDGKGQGSYFLYIKGNEVNYECYGSVCNLKCQ